MLIISSILSLPVVLMYFQPGRLSINKTQPVDTLSTNKTLSVDTPSKNKTLPIDTLSKNKAYQRILTNWFNPMIQPKQSPKQRRTHISLTIWVGSKGCPEVWWSFKRKCLQNLIRTGVGGNAKSRVSQGDIFFEIKIAATAFCDPLGP